jgi:hypothetical protein
VQHLLRGAGEPDVVAGVAREEHLVAGRDAFHLEPTAVTMPLRH